MPDPGTRASLLCLVFTDLVDSTALKRRLSDAAVSELMAGYHRDLLALATQAGGREIDSAGDGFFLAFETPSAAVTFALRLQLLHQDREQLPAVRVGLHVGEVTERPAPPGSSKPTLIEGLAVDLAARIGGLAGGGQVLLSQPVFDAARQRLDKLDLGHVAWRAHGPYLLHSEAGDLVAWGRQQGSVDKVPLATRVDVVTQIADALAAAHSAGALHKDLKPDPDDLPGLGLAEGVDLLIHDAMYTVGEYPRHVGWGHSSFADAMAFAEAAGARRLLPFHHDPSHDDDLLDRLFEEATAEPSPFELVRGEEETSVELGTRGGGA